MIPIRSVYKHFNELSSLVHICMLLSHPLEGSMVMWFDLASEMGIKVTESHSGLEALEANMQFTRSPCLWHGDLNAQQEDSFAN